MGNNHTLFFCYMKTFCFFVVSMWIDLNESAFYFSFWFAISPFVPIASTVTVHFSRWNLPYLYRLLPRSVRIWTELVRTTSFPAFCYSLSHLHLMDCRLLPMYCAFSTNLFSLTHFLCFGFLFWFYYDDFFIVNENRNVGSMKLAAFNHSVVVSFGLFYIKT